MDWFKGKSTGNQGFYMFLPSNCWGFPVIFAIIQFYAPIDNGISSYIYRYHNNNGDIVIYHIFHPIVIMGFTYRKKGMSSIIYIYIDISYIKT